MRGGFTDINGNAFTASTKFQCLSATHIAVKFIMTSVVVYKSLTFYLFIRCKTIETYASTFLTIVTLALGTVKNKPSFL